MRMPLSTALWIIGTWSVGYWLVEIISDADDKDWGIWWGGTWMVALLAIHTRINNRKKEKVLK